MREQHKELIDAVNRLVATLKDYGARVLTTYEAEAEGIGSEQVIQRVLDTVPVP